MWKQRIYVPIRVTGLSGGGGGTLVVEANRQYEIHDPDRDTCRYVDVTGAKGTTAYGFCAETDAQVVLENVPELVRAGKLRAASGPD